MKKGNASYIKVHREWDEWYEGGYPTCIVHKDEKCVRLCSAKITICLLIFLSRLGILLFFFLLSFCMRIDAVF